jgi:hypothetical protein
VSDQPDVAQFDPEPLLAVLERHGVAYVLVGGYAARLHGSLRPTSDVDVTPATTEENLARLAAALTELGARIRTEAEPSGLAFAASAESLRGVWMLNLQTSRGQLDLAFRPAGTDGYEDLDRTASLHTIGRVQVRVAALAEVIRSKEAAGRRKDFQALPELYRLAGRTGAPEPPGNAAVAAQQSTEAARIAAARARARDRRERRHPET